MAFPPKKPGLSLYGNLLSSNATTSASNDSGGAVISSAPVKYSAQQQAEMAKKKRDAPFGQFQPRISRPQQQAKARSAKSNSSVAAGAVGSSSSAHKFSSSTVTEASSVTDFTTSSDKATPKQPSAGSFQRTTFDDFMTNEQYDDVDYDPRKAARGGAQSNKKRKKNKGGEAKQIWSWDDVYDPAFPNKYGEFRGSEEQARANSDWKARLYHYKMKQAEKMRRTAMSGATGSKDEPRKPNKPMNNSIFLPPSRAQSNFAPPASFDNDASKPVDDDDDDDEYDPYAHYGRGDSDSNYELPPAFERPPPAFAPSSGEINTPGGDDAFVKYMQTSAPSSTPPAAPPTEALPPVASVDDAEKQAKMAEAQLKIEEIKKKFAARQTEKADGTSQTEQAALPASASLAIATQPIIGPSPSPQPPGPVARDIQDNGTVSRAPVRYDVPGVLQLTDDGPAAFDQSAGHLSEPPGDEATPQKPGKKGFAQRILEKQGWQKGQGLGAQGQGITTAIVAQAQKRKKRADVEGGGWAAPANMGRIVGGKRAKTAGDSEVQASNVVRYEGLLRGLDAEEEISENGLYQHIGEAMNVQFGTVERVFVWMAGDCEVFVKFTNGMGALKAVTSEFSFKGNSVMATYFPEEKFEDGEYM